MCQKKQHFLVSEGCCAAETDLKILEKDNPIFESCLELEFFTIWKILQKLRLWPHHKYTNRYVFAKLIPTYVNIA